MGKIWTTRYPGWAKTVRNALRDLDAADQVKGRARYDGKYQGVDLKALAALYVKRYSSHQVGVQNIFAAARGLHKYVKSVAPVRGKNDLRILSTALLMGASAVIKGQTPNFKTVPGLRSRFIPEEVRFYFNYKILNRKQAQSVGAWQVFWKKLLANCSKDIFLSRANCNF